MNALNTVLLAVAVTSAFGVVILVLLQHGKGADTGASFGGGSSGSLFGASGSSNFLSRTTAIFISLFFISAIGLSYLSVNHKGGSTSSSVLDRINSGAIPSKGAAGTANPEEASSTTSNFDPASQIPR